MLFITINGIKEINRYDFINDKLYYMKIAEIKKGLLLDSSKCDKNSKNLSEKTFDNKNK
jgi:hypothetical protein